MDNTREVPRGFGSPSSPIARIEGRLLARYAEADFITRLKALFLMLLCASVLFFMALILVYSAIIQRSSLAGGFALNWAILGAEAISLAATAVALAFLVRGRFAVGAHFFLVTSQAGVWAVMFMGSPSSPVAKLDSIAFIIALLCITPLVVSKDKWPIPLYAAANIAMLWGFTLAEAPKMGLAPDDAWDYIADGTLAMALVGVLGFSIHGITSRALARAARDIEERRKAEEALKELNAELENIVALRTEELSMTNLELQAANAEISRAMGELKAAQARVLVSEKLSALGRLSASVAHEINTPLAAIAASNRAGKKYLEPGLDELGRIASGLGPEALAVIRLALDRLRESGRGALAVDPGGERQARRAAAAALSEAAVPGAHEIASDLVECGIADSVERVVPILGGRQSSDFMLLLRASVGTLRTNAIIEAAVKKAALAVKALRGYAEDAASDEGGTIRLAAEAKDVVALHYADSRRAAAIVIDIDDSLEVAAKKTDLDRILHNLIQNAVHAAGTGGTVRLEARALGGDVVASVIDSGPGIEERLKGRIFEPFFTTKVSGEGVGLGLDIARRLARSNGGDIEFESRPGRTEFRVRLRRAREGGYAVGARDDG